MTEIANENPEIRESAEAEVTEVTEVASKVSPVQPKAEEFDWESLESGMDAYTARRRGELENLYNNTLNTVQEKEVQEGTVISMNKREVVIDIGYKSDGIVSLNEFRYNPEMKVGDKVDVYVENLEDPKGQMILSHKKARAMRSWEKINEAHDNGEIIKGFIKCRTKGGMIVDALGIEAFLVLRST
jgi:small subunit ribosomal protein S1